MPSNDFDTPRAVARFDDPRPMFAGEHWADLALCLTAWWLTRKNRSLAVRTLGTFVGATLVARAAHARKPIGSVMRWTPIGGGIERDRD